jgi:hypothetical protein
LNLVKALNLSIMIYLQKIINLAVLMNKVIKQKGCGIEAEILFEERKKDCSE